MVDGLSRIQRLLQEQQWERSLSTSEEAIGDAHDDSPLSATVEGYSGGRVLLRFPGASNPIPGGRMLTSGAIGKGESVLIDQSPSAILDIEGMPWRRPPEEEPVEPEIDTPLLLHLFVISETSYRVEGPNTLKHYFWITDGNRVLKVYEDNPEDKLFSEVANEVFAESEPVGRVLGSEFWVLNKNRFIFQFPLLNTLEAGDGDISKVKIQVRTVLVENWQVTFSDLQEAPYLSAPITYPPQLTPYLKWLTPSHRDSTLAESLIEMPIYQIVTDAQTEEFRLRIGHNADENETPYQVEIRFAEGDVLPDGYEDYFTNDQIRGSYNPPELNLFARSWNLVTPGGERVIELSQLDFASMSSDSFTFTDEATLYDSAGDTYTLGQIKTGEFNPEYKLDGLFQSQPFRTGLNSQLCWLGCKAVF